MEPIDQQSESSELCWHGSNERVPVLIRLVEGEKGLTRGAISDLVSHVALPVLSEGNRHRIVEYVRGCKVIELKPGIYQLKPLPYTKVLSLADDNSNSPYPSIDPTRIFGVRLEPIQEHGPPVTNVEHLVTRINQLFPLREETGREKHLSGEVARLRDVAAGMIHHFSNLPEPSEDQIRELVMLSQCNLATVHLRVIAALAKKLGSSADIQLFNGTKVALQQAKHLDIVHLNLVLVNTFQATRSLPLNRENRPHLIARFELLVEVTKQLVIRGGDDSGANFPADHKDILYASFREYRNLFKGREEGSDVSTFLRELFATQHKNPDIELAYLAVCAKEAVARLRSNRNWRARFVPFTTDIVTITGSITVAALGAPPVALASLSGFEGAYEKVKVLKKSKNGWFAVLLYAEGIIGALGSASEAQREEARAALDRLMAGTEDLSSVARNDQETDDKEQFKDEDRKLNRRHSWYLEYGIARALATFVDTYDFTDAEEGLPEEVALAFHHLKALLVKHQPTDSDEGAASHLREALNPKDTLEAVKSNAQKLKNAFKRRSAPPEESTLLEKRPSDKQISVFKNVYEGVYDLVSHLYHHHDPRVSEAATSCAFDVRPIFLTPDPRDPPLRKLGKTLFNHSLNEIYPAAVPFLDRQAECLKSWEDDPRSGLYVRLKCYVGRLNNSDPRELDHAIQHFLSRPEKVLLVHGSPGVGKTSSAIRLEAQLWEDYDWGRESFVPLYMSSSVVKDFIEDPLYIQQILNVDWGINDQYALHRMKGAEKFVFLCDGLDEVGPLRELDMRHLSPWRNSKFIFFAQTAFTDRTPGYENYLLPKEKVYGEYTERSLEELCVAPLTMDQVKGSYLPEVAKRVPNSLRKKLQEKGSTQQISEIWDNPTTYVDYIEACTTRSQTNDQVVTPFDVDIIVHTLPVLSDEQLATLRTSKGRLARLFGEQVAFRGRMKADLISPQAIANVCGEIATAEDAIMRTNRDIAWHLWENKITIYKRPTSFNDAPLGQYYFSKPDRDVIDGPIIGSEFIDAKTGAWIEKGPVSPDINQYDCCRHSRMGEFLVATVLFDEFKAVAEGQTVSTPRSNVRTLKNEKFVRECLQELKSNAGPIFNKLDPTAKRSVGVQTMLDVMRVGKVRASNANPVDDLPDLV